MSEDNICSMVSANCNTLLNGVDYSSSKNVLAYTSSNLIHIYNIEKVRTYLTLRGHTQRVNSVKFMDSHKIKVITN
jgi:WD40 repeat protein